MAYAPAKEVTIGGAEMSCVNIYAAAEKLQPIQAARKMIVLFYENWIREHSPTQTKKESL